MSFLRHEEIYPCGEAHGAQGEGGELRGREGAILPNHALAHRKDESPTGYSSAGCSPAEPASASPASAIILGFVPHAEDLAVNAKLSLITVSHPWGSLQFTPDCPGFQVRKGLLTPFPTLPSCVSVSSNDSSWFGAKKSSGELKAFCR